jgi:hypothetical protein
MFRPVAPVPEVPSERHALRSGWQPPCGECVARPSRCASLHV